MREIVENEELDYPAVLAIDPGGTTGWCVMMVHTDALMLDDVSILDNILYWEQGQFEGNEIQQAQEVMELMDLWDGAAILIEDFILRQFSMGRELLSPVRITAMLEMWATIGYTEPRMVFKQQSELAKSAITDKRLRAWKLYRPGQEHARDAQRHALTLFRRAKASPALRAKAWPLLYGKADQSATG
jgi:hypothetical protein